MAVVPLYIWFDMFSYLTWLTKEWLKFLGLKKFITKIAFIFPEELYIHEQSSTEGRTASTVWKLFCMKEPVIVPGKESSVINVSRVGV